MLLQMIWAYWLNACKALESSLELNLHDGFSWCAICLRISWI